MPDFLASCCSAYTLRDNFDRRYFSFPYQEDTPALFLTTQTPGEKPMTRMKRLISSFRFTITPSAFDLELMCSMASTAEIWLLNLSLVLARTTLDSTV